MVEQNVLRSNPQVRDDPLLELIVLVNEPQFLERARKLTKQVAKALASSKRAASPALAKPRPGEVLQTIKLVLLEHPQGLRSVEVRKLVEKRLGRSVAKSTAKDALASNHAFRRIRRGTYVCKI